MEAQLSQMSSLLEKSQAETNQMKSINRDLLDLLRQGGNSVKHNNTDITLDTTPLNTQPDHMSSEN